MAHCTFPSQIPFSLSHSQYLQLFTLWDKICQKSISHKTSSAAEKKKCLFVKKNNLVWPLLSISRKCWNNASNWVWLSISCNAAFRRRPVSLEFWTKQQLLNRKWLQTDDFLPIAVQKAFMSLGFRHVEVPLASCLMHSWSSSQGQSLKDFELPKISETVRSSGLWIF